MSTILSKGAILVNLCQVRSWIGQLVIILLLGAILVGCSQRPQNINTGSGNDGAVTPAPALKPVPVEESEPAADSDDQPVDEEAPPILPQVNVFFDGVRFIYDPALISDVVAERISVLLSDNENEANTAPATIPDAVAFTFTLNSVNAVPQPKLMVQPVRQKNGLYFETLPEAQRQLFAELEERVQAAENISNDPSAAQERAVDFVNGSGIRTIGIAPSGSDIGITVIGALAYIYEGLTHDRRYAVQFVFPLATNPVDDDNQLAENLDALLATLFIDSSAEALNVTTCEDDAEFVENLTIPDGTEIQPGETFVKTWRMRNTGTCTWTNTYSWTFTGGHAFEWLETSSIDLVSSGEEIDISVTLVAPEKPGAYAGQWRLTGADEFSGIGSEVYLLIIVPE